MASMNVLVADIGEACADRSAGLCWQLPPWCCLPAAPAACRPKRPPALTLILPHPPALPGGTNCRLQVWQLDKHLRPARMVVEQARLPPARPAATPLLHAPLCCCCWPDLQSVLDPLQP